MITASTFAEECQILPIACGEQDGTVLFFVTRTSQYRFPAGTIEVGRYNVNFATQVGQEVEAARRHESKRIGADDLVGHLDVGAEGIVVTNCDRRGLGW